MTLQKVDRQKMVMLISGLFFLGSMVANAVPMYLQALNPSQTPDVAQPISEADTLKSQERGYEIVLQREPNNPTALEGLASTRLQLNDLQGAIAPLEKLVKLYPDRSDYQAQLADTRKQLGIK